jgi:flagellin-like hook-associated protein FlgL
MQDYDVKAELNKDGKLVLWSPRGYSIQIGGTTDTTDVSTFFTVGSSSLGSSSSTSYRGGYGLDDPTLRDGYSGVYAQNVVTRGGANLTQQNFFGVLDDISAAVRAENRDGLSDKLLPQIDRFMDGLLKALSTNGALQSRYAANISRMKANDLNMTEAHDKLIGADIESMIALTTELTMAQAVYEASLGVISYIVQPTLLDFLR